MFTENYNKLKDGYSVQKYSPTQNSESWILNKLNLKAGSSEARLRNLKQV